MKIFHIIGCECCGRVDVAKAICQANKNVVMWDIYEDFYIKHGIMTISSVDWTKYNEMKDVIGEELTAFIKQNQEDKHIIIVSTGINPNLNKSLTIFRPIVPIVMEILSKYEMSKRAEERNADPYRVLGFIKTWVEKTKNMQLPYYLSEVEAVRYITHVIKEDSNEKNKNI